MHSIEKLFNGVDEFLESNKDENGHGSLIIGDVDGVIEFLKNQNDSYLEEVGMYIKKLHLLSMQIKSLKDHVIMVRTIERKSQNQQVVPSIGEDDLTKKVEIMVSDFKNRFCLSQDRNTIKSAKTADGKSLCYKKDERYFLNLYHGVRWLKEKRCGRYGINTKMTSQQKLQEIKEICSAILVEHGIE